MKRFFILAVALLAMFSVVLTVGAQEDSVTISGTLKGEAKFLPSFANWYGLDLTLTFSSLKAISQTHFTLAPGVNGTQVFKVEYAWDFLTLGSELDLGLVPPAFQSLSLYAKANLFDTTIGEGEFAPSLTADLDLVTVILPAFSGTATFDLETQVGPLAASSNTKLDLVPFAFQSQEFGVELDFLNATFGEEGAGTLVGSLGTDITALPAFSSDLWLKLSLALGDLTATSRTEFELVPAEPERSGSPSPIAFDSVTFTSETTFGLVPYGFTSQRFRGDVAFDALSLYGWGTLASAGLDAGIGFRYDFP